MKINKEQLIKLLVKIIVYSVFLSGLYITDIVYPSLFKWFPYYEPDGIQYIIVLFIAFPVFIIAEILILFCNRFCNFAKMIKYLPLISILFLIIPINFKLSSYRVFGSIVSYAISLFTFCLFIYDVIYGNKPMLWGYKINKKLVSYIVVIFMLLVVIANPLYKKSAHYFKYNIAWNTELNNLTKNEKWQLLYDIFAATNFDTSKASLALQYTFKTCIQPVIKNQDELNFIIRLEKICNGDVLKLGVLNYGLNSSCYQNVIDLSNISINEYTAQHLLSTIYMQGKFHAETTNLILTKYITNLKISRDEKMKLLWNIINNYPHKYKNFLYETNRIRFEILIKYFFSLKPKEYQPYIIKYINTNHDIFVRTTISHYYEE